MRKVLIGSILAGVLVLALSVPALADSAKDYGQGHRDGNWSGGTLPSTDIPPSQSVEYPAPGLRVTYDYTDPYTGTVVHIVGNPGQWVSSCVEAINGYLGPMLDVKNFGQWIMEGLAMVRSAN